MSKNRRPLTDDDRARIARDAETLRTFLRARGRPGYGGTLTVVMPRRSMARALELTVRQLSQAEGYLAERRLIKAVWLPPRDDEEAALGVYRWILDAGRTNA